MTPKEINQLATIVTRFSVLHSTSNTAYKAVQELNFNLFKSSVTSEERELLKEAFSIIERIRDNTTQSDAVNYFNELSLLEEV